MQVWARVDLRGHDLSSAEVRDSGFGRRFEGENRSRNTWRIKWNNVKHDIKARFITEFEGILARA